MPCQVDTYLKSDTRSRLGRSALHRLRALSFSDAATGAEKVVRTTLPRTTTCKPRRHIRRATVQRATAMLFALQLSPALSNPIDLQVVAPDMMHLAGQ
jgi:hypothetical protein